MHHVHRPNPHDNPEDLMHGPFWARHRNLDNELSNAFMFLPAKLTLPQNMRDPIALHTNLNLHASVICLHHAAIEKAEKYNHTDAVKRSSLTRLKASAEEIVNIVRLTCHSTAVFVRSAYLLRVMDRADIFNRRVHYPHYRFTAHPQSTYMSPEMTRRTA